MPLKHGCSNKVKSENIREMMHAGHPQKQAIAAAYSNCRRDKKLGRKKKRKRGTRKR